MEKKENLRWLDPLLWVVIAFLIVFILLGISSVVTPFLNYIIWGMETP